MLFIFMFFVVLRLNLCIMTSSFFFYNKRIFQLMIMKIFLMKMTLILSVQENHILWYIVSIFQRHFYMFVHLYDKNNWSHMLIICRLKTCELCLSRLLKDKKLGIILRRWNLGLSPKEFFLVVIIFNYIIFSYKLLWYNSFLKNMKHLNGEANKSSKYDEKEHSQIKWSIASMWEWQRHN